MKTLTPIILILIAIALSVFVINPEYKKAEALVVQKEENEKLLEKARELEERRNDLETQFKAFSAKDIERLKKMIPDTIDNIRLIIDIDTIAKKRGIQLNNFSITKNDSNIEQQEGVVVSTSGSGLGTITLRFNMQATYSKFLDFLRDLEQSLRIVDVRVLTLGTGGGANYTYSIEIDTYWLR